MAYFSNGTEGEMYEAEYCNNCVHQKPDDGGCPVLLLHLLYNYDQCDKTDVGERTESVLDILIPREGVQNCKCNMFHPLESGSKSGKE